MVSSFKSRNNTNGKDCCMLHKKIHNSFVLRQGGAGVLWHHHESLSQALVDLYPELKFDIIKFVYWRGIHISILT